MHIGQNNRKPKVLNDTVRQWVSRTIYFRWLYGVSTETPCLICLSNILLFLTWTETLVSRTEQTLSWDLLEWSLQWGMLSEPRLSHFARLKAAAMPPPTSERVLSRWPGKKRIWRRAERCFHRFGGNERLSSRNLHEDSGSSLGHWGRADARGHQSNERKVWGGRMGAGRSGELIGKGWRQLETQVHLLTIRR